MLGCASWPAGSPAGSMLDVARRGPARPRGVGRIDTAPYQPDAGDLDFDASSEAIVEARAAQAGVDPERLRVRRWVQPRTAVCLLVDRSGSMSGRPLATNAVAAAAVAFRSPTTSASCRSPRTRSSSSRRTCRRRSETVVDGVLAAARPRHHRPRRRPRAPPASSSPDRPPDARSPCCCRTAGRPSRAMSSSPRRRSTSWRSSPPTATTTTPSELAGRGRRRAHHGHRPDAPPPPR